MTGPHCWQGAIAWVPRFDPVPIILVWCSRSFNYCQGNYIAPTVFRDCSDHMRTFREEVFGPVMTLTRFTTIDEVPPPACYTY